MLITVFLMVVVTVVSGCVFFFISGNGMELDPPCVFYSGPGDDPVYLRDRDVASYLDACRADGLSDCFGSLGRSDRNNPIVLFLSNFSVSSSEVQPNGW
jgi:hypothetical protein